MGMTDERERGGYVMVSVEKKRVEYDSQYHTCLRCEPLDFSMRRYLRGTWAEDEILVSEGGRQVEPVS